MAKVDVVIPNYQYGRYLGRCIDSVLGQSLGDIRVLIVDNASTDESVEVAKAAMARDSRVSLLTHTRNVGHALSINEGIDWAASDYFLVLCSDDILAGGALARAAAVMDRNRDVAFCMGDYRHFTNNHDDDLDFGVDQDESYRCRIWSGAQFLRELCRRPLISTGNFLITRTQILKRVGHYRPYLLQCDDLELILRLCELGHYAELSAVQGFRRLHAGNLANAYRDSKLARLNSVVAAFDSYFSNEGCLNRDWRQLRAEARRRLASQAYWAGVAHLISRQRQAAKELFRFAFQQSPRCRMLPPVEELFSARVFNKASVALREAAAARAAWPAARRTQINP